MQELTADYEEYLDDPPLASGIPESQRTQPPSYYVPRLSDDEVSQMEIPLDFAAPLDRTEIDDLRIYASVVAKHMVIRGLDPETTVLYTGDRPDPGSPNSHPRNMAKETATRKVRICVPEIRAIADYHLRMLNTRREKR